MAALDWAGLRAEYISSGLSYGELAQKHGISKSAIGKIGKREDWPRLRAEYLAEASKRALEDGVEYEVDRLKKIMQAATAMSDVIAGIYADPQQFYRHLVQDKFVNDDGGMDIVTVEKIYKKADTRAIKDLTGAMRDMTLVMRNLFNLPTQAEKEAQRIAAERLKLEQHKAVNEDDGAKRVIIKMDDMEEYAQ
jgi:hypothetical protein